MRLHFVTFGCLFAFAAALDGSTIGISVNGTCEGGSCPGLPLPFSTTETLPFDFLFTLANGDMYLIDGSFTDNNNSDGSGASNSYAFQVTYEGNANGGLSGADTITVQRDAEFETSIASADFTTSLIGAFSPGIAATSSASSCFGGTLACLGPVTPPGSFDENSSTFAITSSGGAFVDDKTFVNNFGAGSPGGLLYCLGPDYSDYAAHAGACFSWSNRAGSGRDDCAARASAARRVRAGAATVRERMGPDRRYTIGHDKPPGRSEPCHARRRSAGRCGIFLGVA
jgi:hypothetical protein